MLQKLSLLNRLQLNSTHFYTPQQINIFKICLKVFIPLLNFPKTNNNKLYHPLTHKMQPQQSQTKPQHHPHQLSSPIIDIKPDHNAHHSNQPPYRITNINSNNNVNHTPDLLQTNREQQQNEELDVEHQQQLREAEELNRNRKQVGQYFKKMSTKYRESIKQAQMMNQIVKHSICMGIKTGELQIDHQRGSLDKIMFESRIKQSKNPTKQQQVQQQRKRAAIEAQLKYLDLQLVNGRKAQKHKEQEQNQFSGMEHNNVILTKKQHQQFLSKVTKERIEIQSRRKSLEAKQKQKEDQQQKNKKLFQEQQELKQKQEKKKKIIQKLEQQKKLHEQKVKQEQEHNRRLTQLKSKKFLHEKLQEKYNTEILIPSLEQKKKKLKQIRQMSKAFNVQDIKAHQKQYLRKRQQVHSASQSKVKQQWQYKVPQKSQRLAKLLQQEGIQAKLKLEQKKRKLEQRIQRQEQFVNYLKQRYPPTIDPRKKQQIEQRLRLKSQTKQKQLPDRKTLGINYLQQVKNQRKKSANSQMQFQRKHVLLEAHQIQPKKSQTNYLKTRKPKQYEQLRERRIQKLINSQGEDKYQKIMKLQIESNKLIEQQKRKQEINKIINKNKNSRKGQEQDVQSTNLLLASIKAKMGIIDLYNKDD